MTPAPDRLTIARVLALTAGMALGLGALTAEGNEDEFWLYLGNAAVAGLSLPAPWLLLVRRGQNRTELSAAQIYLLTVGLGVWTMLPPAVIGRFSDQRTTSVACLFYVLPLVGLWFLFASLLARDLPHRLVAPATPWTERYAYCLALLWSPLGAWHLFQFYREVF